MTPSALGAFNPDSPTLNLKAVERIPACRGPVDKLGRGVARPPQRPRRLQQFFERAAAQRPFATAVLDEDRALTYRELDGRANQLAHHLRRARIGPGRGEAAYAELRSAPGGDTPRL